MNRDPNGRELRSSTFGLRPHALPSDGKAVAVGTDNSVSPARLLIARFTTAGAGDSTFNGGLGYNVARIGSGPDTGAALLATGDGRLIVAGTDQAGSSAGIGLFQFLQSTGTLDPGFAGGVGEERVAPPGGDAGTANALTLDGAGRLVVAGRDTTSQHLLVSRLSAAGALDGSFGSGGFSIPSIGASAGAQGVAIDAAGNNAHLQDRSLSQSERR